MITLVIVLRSVCCPSKLSEKRRPHLYRYTAVTYRACNASRFSPRRGVAAGIGVLGHGYNGDQLGRLTGRLGSEVVYFVVYNVGIYVHKEAGLLDGRYVANGSGADSIWT